jgi:diguanylate cyclase (GGDEF)-like protein
METAVVTNPMDILESLSEFRPELILMDVYMPGCSGMEVAKIIRQKDAFVSTPIVFLSAETDIEKQLAAMSLGGDDFLTKPILPWHLVSAVTARIERHRILRSFMIRDSLTGLLNHTKTKEQLDIEVAHAERRHSDLSFAMIDLDHFKSVNDTYGHVTGDKVLKSLSRLLRQRLRKTDIVGRYGGEEFGLVLVDMNGDTAVRILDEIREDFAKIRHYSREADFSVTFSCGVAAFPRYRTRSRLNEAADKALYEAKRRGRNRVVLATDGDQGSQ